MLKSGALERRLPESSKQTGLPITRLRKAIVFERLVARLIRAGGDRRVMKDAVELELRTKVQNRATKDLDLGYARAAEDVLATLRSEAAGQTSSSQGSE